MLFCRCFSKQNVDDCKAVFADALGQQLHEKRQVVERSKMWVGREKESRGKKMSIVADAIRMIRHSYWSQVSEFKTQKRELAARYN